MKSIANHLGLPLGAACSAGFLWGTGALVVNLLIAQHGYTPTNISFWRFVVGALVLSLVFRSQIHWRQLKPLILTVIGAGTAMAGYVLCWFLGIERIGASIPTLIALCLPPVLVTLVALARGQEQGSAPLFAMLAAALIGTVMIVGVDGHHDGIGTRHDLVIGVSFSLASAFLYAGFTLVSGSLSTKLGAGQASTCLTVVAALIMGLSGWYRPLSWPIEVPPQAWYLYLGVVTAALAILIFSWGAARLTPTTLTVATLIEPLTAVLLAALILGERLQAWQWVGGGLLLFSIWGLGRRPAPSVTN